MNKLRYINDLKRLLKDYQPSKESLLTLSKVQLVLLVAPTSTGRNTVIRELMKTGDYHFIISDTTRNPRSNDGVMEKNGVEYWFRLEEDVLEDVKNGKYLEAAVIHNQQVSGISVRELEKAKTAKKIAITDAEIAGAESAIKRKSDTLVIFLLPPSFEEWQRRLKARGEMNKDEYKNRMISAAKELKTALEKDYYRFIINDSVENATEQINKLVKKFESGSRDIVDDKKSRALAEDLHAQTNSLIESLN